MRNIKIYQTNHYDYRFMNHEYFMKIAGFIDLEEFSYREVFTGQFELSSNDMVACEQVFVMLNNHHPENYTARSLSVSDIISLDDKLFFVDAIGFMKIDHKDTAEWLFKKCLFEVKKDRYFQEAIDLIDSSWSNANVIETIDSVAVAELSFDSCRGITLKIGLNNRGSDNSTVATLFTYDTSKNAFRLMGELCSALSYQLSQYIDGKVKEERAA